MKQMISTSLMVCALAIAGSVSGIAAETNVITFGTTSRDIGNDGPFDESGYQYLPVGASWSLQDAYGSSGNALFTFWGQPSAPGNTITFTSLDNNPFLFLSVDLEGRLQGQRNDVVVARGYLNGVQVGSMVLQSSNMVWSTESTQSAFTSPIDTLQLQETEYNSAALILDNFTFESVPEPAEYALLVTGLSALTWLRIRRTA